jgi:uncharacterized damage-inducible protein DinB
VPSGYFETLMRHHAWAAGRLLDAAMLVPPAQLGAELLSHGSLVATLRHVADVDQSWGRAARGEPGLAVEEGEQRFPDLASLRAFWFAETAALVEFARGLSADDLDREVQPP